MTVRGKFEIKSALTFSLPVTMALSMFIPAATSAENPAEATSLSQQNITVQKGDTLTKILLRTLGSYSLWREVAAYNKLVSPYILKPGDVLVLPDSILKRYPAISQKLIREVVINEHRIAKHSVDHSSKPISNIGTSPIKVETIKNVTHDDLVIKARQGDSLSRILLGNIGSHSAIDEVAKYNNLVEPDSLQPGDIIRIPSWLLTNKLITWDEQKSENTYNVTKKDRPSDTDLEIAELPDNEQTLKITPHGTVNSTKEQNITKTDDHSRDEKSPSIENTQPEDDLPIPRPELQRVTLQRISVEGNTAISDAELVAISEPYLNRPLRFSDLEQLRIDITRAYTDRGFISSGAVLPNQKIANGQLTYRVVEGQLDEIEVSGTGRLKPAYVANRVRAAAGQPFNSIKLQESFQLLLDDPLIDRMDGQLLPQPETGLTKLKLAVTPAAPWSLNLTVNNHGSPSVGAEQLALAGTYLNPTGLGDRTDFSFNVSPGRYNLSAAYSVPISARDTRLTLDFGATNSTVIEEPLDDIDIESDSANIGLSLSHPLRRSTKGSLTVGADFTVRDNSNTLLGEPFSFSAGEENGDSRVTALRLWQDLTRKRSDQVLAFRSSFNFGLDSFGSTVNSDDLPDSEFVSWLGQMRLVRNVQDGAGRVLLKANGQYTNETLLPLERFSLGGADSVRGFRKNQLVRDNALLLSAEYQYSFYNSPSAGEWKVAPFVDYGYGRNKGAEVNSETLTSTGIGFLWSKDKFNADLYFGHALENTSGSTDNGLQDDGIHFRFSTRIY